MEWRAGRVAPEAGLVAAPGVLGGLGRDVDAGDAELVAVVERRRAPERQEQHRGHAGLGRAEPGRDPRLVVVAQHPVGPAARRQRGLVVGDHPAQRRDRPGREDHLEVERQVGAVAVRAVVGHQPVDRQVDLADQHPLVVGVHRAPHRGHDRVHLGLVCAVDLQQPVDLRLTRPVVGVGRIVAEFGILDHEPHHVDPEPVRAAVEPEPHGGDHGILDGRVAPVQVWLLAQEAVQVPLAGGGIEGPGRTAEVRHPVVWRHALAPAVPPDVPVALGAVPRRPAVAEPGVLVGGVAGHEVQDDLEASRVGVGHQVVERGERPEQGVDVAVIGHVVAEIRHGRRIDWRDPDRVHAEPGHVVEAPPDALEVADAVAVGVLERARVDLVHGAALPPQVLGHGRPAAARWPRFAPATRSARVTAMTRRGQTFPGSGTRRRPRGLAVEQS